MKLVTVDEMRKIEHEAEAGGLTYEQMMATAGTNLAMEVQSIVPSQEGEEIQVLGLVGPGNNGGDTLVALTALAEKGWKACAYLVRRKSSGDELVTHLKDANGEIVLAEKDNDYAQLTTILGTADVVLDGLLGTGTKLPLKDEIGQVLAATKAAIAELDWTPYIVAVDCPSGVDCDSGQVDPKVLDADVTITMAAVKQGLLKTPAFDKAGEIRVVDIGLKDDFPTWKAITDEVADEAQISSLLPQRPSDAHKGSFGTAMIVAGSFNYTGAVLLSGKAAYRIGAGLVNLAIPAALHAVLAGHFPEATWLLLPHEMGVIAAGASNVVIQNLDRVTALLLGPGFGLEDTTQEFLENLFNETPAGKSPHGRIGFLKNNMGKSEPKTLALPPMVVDADGLKLLARLENWPKILPAPAVLTPHPGEMAILTGLTIDDIQKDRLETARHFAQKWGHVVVLKGAFTVVAAPDGRTTTLPVATPALARAGTGDVLAGLIVGLRAQGVEAYPAALAAAWIHAQAGLVAAEVVGNPASVMAGDILEAVPDVMAEFS